MIEQLPLTSPINNAPVYFAESVTSTMDAAAVLADQGVPCGTVIQADFQSEGRSRRRTGGWDSPAGANLLFTVLLEKETEASLLLRAPLLLGLGVAVALEREYALDPLIKWPNDVLARDGRKLCGILCRARRRYLLAGIGINCNQRRFPPGLAETAVSLALLLDGEIDRRRLMLAVLTTYQEISRRSDWREEIERRLAFRGEVRTFVPEGEADTPPVRGVVEALGPGGELMLRPPEGSLSVRCVSGSLV